MNSNAVEHASPMRIVIAGAPKVGKTTLANHMAAETGVKVRHTDDLIGSHDWSAASQAASHWFDEAGPWVVEGVTAPRALRKWLASHPVGKPCEVVLWSMAAKTTQSGGQSAMAKGCETVWLEILPELKRRGVQIQSF